MTPRRETDPMEALVRAHLDRQAAAIDGGDALARVKAALARPPRAHGRRWRSRLALAAGLAAAFALLLVSGPHRNPAQASSRDLVRQVRDEHQRPLERCYAGEIRHYEQQLPLPPAARRPRQVRVWTRGDRFWVTMRHADSEPYLVWGREKDGSLWAVLAPDRGVRVSAEQAPRPLTLLADAYSLDVDALLDHVLRDCSITEQTGGDDSVRVLRAEPLSARTRRWLGHATLEIDARRRVLRRLTLARNWQGRPYAEVDFRLVETRPAQGEKYRLESHLRPPCRIHQGNVEPAVKLELAARWFGLKARQDRTKPVTVKDVDGKSHSPLSLKDKKAAVLFFLLPDCPISNAYAPEIERITQAYAKKGVAAFVVHADPDTTAKQAKEHAKERKLTATVLLDPTHRLVNRTGVTTAPEAAVVGPDGKTLYRGRIDDWYVDYGKRRSEPTRHDLRDALDAILAGKAPPTTATKALGCPLPEARKE